MRAINKSMYQDEDGLIWLDKIYNTGDVVRLVANTMSELNKLDKKKTFIPLSTCHALIIEIYDSIAHGDSGMFFFNDYMEFMNDYKPEEAITESEALSILICTLTHSDAFKTGTVTDDNDGITVYSAFINYFIDDRKKGGNK